VLDIKEHGSDQAHDGIAITLLWHSVQAFGMECGDRFIPSLALHRLTDCFSFVTLYSDSCSIAIRAV
jgi:hypothetical protein